MTACPDSKIGDPCEPVCALCGSDIVVGRLFRTQPRLYPGVDESMARHPAGRAQPQREDAA